MSASATWLTIDRIFDDGEGEHVDLVALTNLRRHGACTAMDPSVFYPARGISALPAKEACWTCPVRAECLTFAIENREWDGIWGGYSEKERRPMNSLRRQGMPVEQVVTMALAGDLDEAMARRRNTHRPAPSRKNLPYGWTVQGAEVVPDPAEQAVVAQMNTWTAAGATDAEAARRLNTEGIRTRLGALWTSAGVRRALSRLDSTESERRAS